MKKAHRSLILSIFALVLAISVTAASTFAWFSMNTTVTAKGMSIKAKSDTKFLQIVTSTGEFSTTEAQIEATASSTTTGIYPVVPAASVEDDGSNMTAYAGATTPVWAYTFSDDPDNHAKATSQKWNKVADGDLNKYTLLTEYKVRLRPSADVDAATNLKVKGVTVTVKGTDNADDKLADAVTVLVIGANAGVVVKNGGTSDTAISNEVTTVAQTIKVYAYFDGTNAACKTANTGLTPDEYDITVTLGVD